MLRIVEFKGRFSDRKVIHIRVFDPLRAEERALAGRTFRDLDVYPDLVLRAGHGERAAAAG